jgi:hypothetical protein
MTVGTTTLNEQQLARIATLLQPIANAAVYRSREAALARAEGIAILIRPEEDLVDNIARDVVFRSFRVLITVIARGDIPDQVADPARLAVNATLLADQTLGGLSARVFEEETKWDFEVADQNAVAAVMRFRIRYATRAADLSAQAPFAL